MRIGGTWTTTGRAVVLPTWLGAVLAGLSLVLPFAPASAQEDPEKALADRFAPVVRMQVQSDNCENGEQYQPTDIDAVLGDQQVALRGPWANADLIAVGPSGAELGRGLPNYFLDFPGDALSPGCTYSEWSRLINEYFAPTVYAHVAKDPARPGQLALQYWFFYVFNDYNNNHEGDWESIQLVFSASSAEEALTSSPVSIGYSQHGGGERALWDDEKLQLVDGTHPVVYPAAGSHANHFETGLFLGRGSDGLGCDNTTQPDAAFRPRVAVVPGSQTAAVREYPWLAFEGRWGERQRGFFNGPTGPAMKTLWIQPIRDAEDSWRAGSPKVPAGSSLGPSATNAFCRAVATGSNIFRATLQNLWFLVLLVAAAIALLWFAVSRTRWSPAAPFPLHSQREWGQSVVCALRVYGRAPTVLLALGAVLLPLGLLTGLVTQLGISTTNETSLSAPTEDSGDNWLSVVGVCLAVVVLLAYVAIIASAALALRQLDAGQRPTITGTYRQLRPLARPLLGVTARYYLTVTILTALVATVPLAIFYVVSRAYAIPSVVLEGRSAGAALRRSRQLVRGHWWRNATALVIVVALGLSIGPLLGIVLLLATEWPALTINLAASLVFAAMAPLVALAYTYMFVDRIQARIAVPAREDVLA